MEAPLVVGQVAFHLCISRVSFLFAFIASYILTYWFPHVSTPHVVSGFGSWEALRPHGERGVHGCTFTFQVVETLKVPKRVGSRINLCGQSDISMGHESFHCIQIVLKFLAFQASGSVDLMSIPACAAGFIGFG